MRRGTRLTAAASLPLLAAALAGCEREERTFREAPPSADPARVVRVSQLEPGPTLDTAHLVAPDDRNAFALSEGQRLFNWYNCSGCHANGGGGMGPPLIDDEWTYGSAPENVYATIVQGRPNGMPSFAGRIPAPQVWQLVSYVRSLSGLTPSAARSSRPDHMMYTPGSQSLAKPERPKQAATPSAAEMP